MYLLENEFIGVVMTINCLQKISYIEFVIAYDLRCQHNTDHQERWR
jgi:hypothetical protein